MSNADTPERPGVAGARARWGAQVAVRSAGIVIERAGQLPDDIREQVHQATAPAGESGDDGPR